MRRFPIPTFTLAATLLLGLGGCFDINETLVLKKDGSGTYSMKAVFDTKKMDEIKKTLGEMFGGEGGGDFDGAPISQKDFDIEELKKKVATIEGLKILKAEPINDTEKGLQGMLVELSFTHLEALAKTGVWQGDSVEMEKGADGSWSFHVRRVPKEAIEQSGSEEAAAMMPMIEGMLGPLVEGLSFKSTWVLPGTVSSSTGTANAEGHLVWSTDFKSIISNPGALNRSATFRGEGIVLKPFSMKTAEDDSDDAPATPDKPKVEEEDAVPSAR